MNTNHPHTDSQVPGNGNQLHEPIMVTEVITHLKLKPDAVIIDGTVGLGGHAEALLEAAPQGHLLGLDRDKASLALAQERLAKYGNRVTLAHSNFADMQAAASRAGKAFTAPDAVLLDLGISSWQLATRGFSFAEDAPLDFRMDEQHGTKATELLKLPERDLADLLYKYGEEYRSRRIAKAIVERMSQAPIDSTQRLAKVIEAAVGRRGRLHPATKSFQALRIAANDELGSLERGLAAAAPMLTPQGRIAVISFHSLEDRIVKQTFKNPDLFTVITKRVIKPSREETLRNPRSRSAKLRIAETAQPTAKR